MQTEKYLANIIHFVWGKCGEHHWMIFLTEHSLLYHYLHTNICLLVIADTPGMSNICIIRLFDKTDLYDYGFCRLYAVLCGVWGLGWGRGVLDQSSKIKIKETFETFFRILNLFFCLPKYKLDELAPLVADPTPANCFNPLPQLINRPGVAGAVL